MKANRMAQLITENARLQAKVNELLININLIKAYTVQQCIDIAEITNNEVFGVVARNANWERAFRDNVRELITGAEQEDADQYKLNKKNSDLAWTFTRMDDALARATIGAGADHDALPLQFEERYQMRRLAERGADMGIVNLAKIAGLIKKDGGADG